jgi:hypothetical protein
MLHAVESDLTNKPEEASLSATWCALTGRISTPSKKCRHSPNQLPAKEKGVEKTIVGRHNDG